MPQLSRRRFVRATALVAATWRAPRLWASANEQINLGIVGLGIRGKEHLATFQKLSGVRIAGLCDPDRERLDAAGQLAPGARRWIHMRDLFDAADIDAVVIATCNHWHALAALSALEAGKHVYVEKPLSHTHEEGVRLVEAAKASGLIVQVGTQQRSDPMQAELKRLLHDEQALGSVQWVLVNRFGPRGPIGLRDAALRPPASVDYDAWLGPAQDLPMYRRSFHYDWHWDWNTGSGEMGNWGVHVLDDARNVVFQDKATLPERIVGVGSRVAWHDAGETPNVQFAAFDVQGTPLVVNLCNLPDKPLAGGSFGTAGPDTGYVAFCEGGRLEGQRGRAVAFDAEGKQLREFRGTNGEFAHRQNFLDAIRAGDATMLNAPVEAGHFSTAWCNLANIAARLSCHGDGPPIAHVADRFRQPAVRELYKHLHGIASRRHTEGDEFALGPELSIDVEAQVFTGENCKEANRYLARSYRDSHRLPDLRARLGGAASDQLNSGRAG